MAITVLTLVVALVKLLSILDREQYGRPKTRTTKTRTRGNY